MSAESLAGALKPYIKLESISLDQFIDNPKYIQVAYLLDVKKFQPRFRGKSRSTLKRELVLI